MIKLIMAMDRNRLIGKQGKLPWHIKGDLKHFKETTLNHTILMGQVTFENMPKLLTNRSYWLLTNSEEFIKNHQEHRCFSSIESIVEAAKNMEDDLYVAGGASVYRQMFPFADEVILSVVEGDYDGDTYLVPFEDDFVLDKVVKHEGFEVRYYRKDD